MCGRLARRRRAGRFSARIPVPMKEGRCSRACAKEVSCHAAKRREMASEVRRGRPSRSARMSPRQMPCSAVGRLPSPRRRGNSSSTDATDGSRPNTPTGRIPTPQRVVHTTPAMAAGVANHVWKGTARRRTLDAGSRRRARRRLLADGRDEGDRVLSPWTRSRWLFPRTSFPPPCVVSPPTIDIFGSQPSEGWSASTNPHFHAEAHCHVVRRPAVRPHRAG